MVDKTYFASSERSNELDLANSNKKILSNTFLSEVLQKLPQVLGILNDKRQFVFFNTSYFKDLGYNEDFLELGKRPGEIFSCLYAESEPGGCGTTQHCRYCGVVNVFLKAQKTKTAVSDEARLTVKKGNSFTGMDIEVSVVPFDFQGENFYIISMVDISQKKMRSFLERAFFHDSLNIISGLKGILELLSKTIESENRELIDTSISAIAHLLDTFGQYRILNKAEAEEIELKPVLLEPFSFMNDLKQRAKGFQAEKEIQVIIDMGNPESLIKCDKTLLERVLVNMLKNAIEASEQGAEIQFCYRKSDSYEFSVKNQGVIPMEIQNQIFQRSFSTKGTGRGIGTYSMKLITEKYLGGEVSFVSDKENQTVFCCKIPLGLKL